MIPFYDAFAPFYDRWVSQDILTKQLTQIYANHVSNLHQYTSIVYLGIATGRIALEIAKRNPHHSMTGIDNSKKMLQLCEKNFQNSSCDITLLHQDILDLHIKTSNNIFLFPFRTLGHFISLEEKRDALTSIYTAMKKNECLIFDFDSMNEDLAKKVDNKHILSFHDEVSGTVIYNKFDFNFKMQEIQVNVYSGNIKDKKLENLQQYNYQFSWAEKSQIREIVLNIGFEIISVSQNTINYIFVVKKII